MAFRLPPNLAIGQQYGQVIPTGVTALEESLPSGSRMLVGLVFERRYEGFEGDCERAEAELLRQAGLSMWPEYSRFVTPDPDGEPIAWVSYQSSPAWWTILLVILGGIFILPIIGSFGAWIIDLMFPGITELLTLGILVFVMFLVIRPMTKSLAPAKEEAK